MVRGKSKKDRYKFLLTSARHMIAARWPSNWENLVPAIFRK